jgi:hypothetical protein
VKKYSEKPEKKIRKPEKQGNSDLLGRSPSRSARGHDAFQRARGR